MCFNDAATGREFIRWRKGDGITWYGNSRAFDLTISAFEASLLVH